MRLPDNRLKTYNGTTYYYDELGNLIHRELADGEVQNYFYDLHDQLVKAEIFKKDGTKETWCYTYDALGRRIGKGRLKNEEVSGSLENQTRFVWDGSHLLQEIQPDGRYTYIYTDPDSYEPLAQVRNRTNREGESKQEINYFHCDQIGIPREMTDKDGNLLWFGNYTGWGRLKEETKVTDSAYQPFRLQNQYADRETGLHYNFFRYYEPDAGRFVSQDPIRLTGSINFYAFAPNAKRWVDPLGLWGCNPATASVSTPAQMKKEGKPIRLTAKGGIHSEFLGIERLAELGCLEGQPVTISDITAEVVGYDKDGKRTAETKPIGICQDCRSKLFERLLDGGATSVTLPITKSNQVMKMITISRSQFQTVHDKIQALGNTASTARSNAMWDIMEEAACGC